MRFSHGLGSVHDRHYNQYQYEEEIRSALSLWEAEQKKIACKEYSLRESLTLSD